MKIIIFAAYFYPHKGGMENYVYNLFKDQKGLDMTVVTSNTEGAKVYEEIDGFKIHRLGCHHILGDRYPIFNLKARSFLKKLPSDYDYVITQTRFFNASLIGAMFAKRNGIPLIHFEHGTEHVPEKNHIMSWMMQLYDHTFGRYIIKNASINVGISQASLKLVKHIYPKAKNCSLITNCIDTAQFLRKKDITLRKKLSGGKRLIIYVGRLIYAKGIQDLIHAVENMDDVKILIIGEGDYKNSLERLAAKLNVSFVFLGKKDIKDIASLLSISDVFVNPSYAEGLPTSVLEAGASSLSVIATDVGGTREIITNNVDGYLVKPHDIQSLHYHIQKLLDDKRLCVSVGSRLRKRVLEDFDVENNRRKLLALLKRKW